MLTTPTIRTNGSVHGLSAVLLENEWLEISILPDVGAKLFDLRWKPSRREFLWHNPRIRPQAYTIEANFDNYWCGGWDEGFPTCDACEYKGESYPNLGELRSVRWDVRAADRAGGDVVARLGAFGPISPVRAEKTVTLSGTSPVLKIQYQIENLGPAPLDFIWGTHPALTTNGQTILKIPARTGIVGLSPDSSLGVPGQRYAWPTIVTPGGQIDMSRTRGIDANVFCGHYVTDLEAGWYAVEDTQTGEGFLLTFPVETCPYLWLWLVYGGWRGYHHIIVEPWTSYPVHLADAARGGTSRRLGPGASFSAEVRATIYTKEECCEDALRRLQTTAI
jgi:galactose mutarotase-like enzyme